MRSCGECVKSSDKQNIRKKGGGSSRVSKLVLQREFDTEAMEMEENSIRTGPMADVWEIFSIN